MRLRVPIGGICVVAMMASACGSDVVGDWFPCDDAQCAELDNDGFRLTSDDRWIILKAAGGSLDPNEEYCEGVGPGSTGVFDVKDDLLIVTNPNGSPSVATYSLNDDKMFLIAGNDASVFVRVDSSRSLGPCTEDLTGEDNRAPSLGGPSSNDPEDDSSGSDGTDRTQPPG